ncbi:hypothetical protein EWI61_05820 [Methylolobus aquaticus]|nr:hypothetical protein EWI61_05820 [Methylolobus aquaticus]
MNCPAFDLAAMRRLSFRALLTVVFCLPAHGDWSGYSRYAAVIEVDVGSDAVTIEICMPDAALRRLTASAGRTPATPAEPALIAQGLLQLSAEQGPAMTPHIDSVRTITSGQATPGDCGVTSGDVYAVRLTQPLPPAARHLTIHPYDGTGADALALMVLHHGVPVSDLGALQKAVRVRLDPDDPWGSRIDDPGFVRRHNEPRSFLYVEPYEVRHELLIRTADLLPLMQLGTAETGIITASERPAVLQQIGAYLQTHNTLAIDGVDALPQLDRLDFVRYTREGVRPIEETGRIDARSALLGVQLTYLTEAPARAIRLHWDLFGQGSISRPISVIQGQESFDGYATPANPVFEWTQDDAFEPLPATDEIDTSLPLKDVAPTEPGSIPTNRHDIVLALTAGLLWRFLRDHRSRTAPWFGAVAGCALVAGIVAYWRSVPSTTPPVTTSAMVAILEPLLHNAYRAFQLRGEEAAYDRLSLSLGSPLLDDIYLQQRRALLRQEEGLGGEGKVNRIEILSAEIVDAGTGPDTCEVDTRWIAHGTVSHWGHSHPRRNAYRARIALSGDQQGHWKIIGLTFLDDHRLDDGERT